VGQGTTPHFFKIVIAADFGPEEVHDDVARIDQHPIALRLPLDRYPGSARERLFEMLGQRQYLARRAAARDDHMVGDRRLAGKVDRDDLLRLAILESLKNELKGSRGLLVGRDLSGEGPQGSDGGQVRSLLLNGLCRDFFAPPTGFWSPSARQDAHGKTARP